jgi:cis-3-alkyl-4-acyloxetan-2-one decarboxylase
MTHAPPKLVTHMATLIFDGIEVFIDGNGPSTVLMLHGWPDTHRLWDSTVDALKAQHRCVRFSLPGFDLAQAPRPTAPAAMTALISKIANTVSPDQPITLLLHDWGCIFGYEFAAQHPARVQRMVAVDIGDHNSGAFARSLSAKAKLMVLAYQMWLAIAWKLGTISPSLGNGMARWMARALRCPAPALAIGWQMNYHYAMKWLGLAGGLKGLAPVKPQCPVLFLYGERKPFMFHSPKWLEQLAARSDCKAQGFATGHWVMVQQPVAFNQTVQEWLG